MIGHTIIELERVDSTNIYANKLLQKSDLIDGTVIWALEQFAGKGQHEHVWESEPGRNLTFTLVVKPVFLQASQQFMLNKAIALGMVDYLDQALNHPDNENQPETIPGESSAVSIKWPNDLYVGNQKIGGILIEHRIMGEIISVSLAGIGLNVNQTTFSTDLPNPVSIIQIMQHEFELKEALTAVCLALNRRYLMLKSGDFSTLDNDFKARLLGYGLWRNYLRDGSVFEGKITGVDDLGCLMIEMHGGSVTCFGHRDVEYIGKW